MDLVCFVAVFVAAAAEKDILGVQLPGWITDLLKQSPALAFGLAVFVLAFRYIQSEHAKHLASKDAEIDRLVKERDKLQNIILKNRLTTEEPPLSPPPPSSTEPKQGRKPKK